MSSGIISNSRDLAPSEIVSDILHSYGSEVLLHIAVTKSDFLLTEDDFRKALVLLTDFQPALRMHIVTENKGKEGITKRFVETKHLEHNVTIKRGLGSVPWLRVAEEELRSGFNTEEGPLWKVVFIDLSGNSSPTTEENGTLPNGNIKQNGSSDSNYGYVKFQKKKGRVHFKEEYEGVLLFKVHHVIADGMSMFDVIHRQLFPLLHKIITKGTIRGFETPLSMLPGVDESFLSKDDGISRRNSLQRKSSIKKRSRHKSSTSNTQTLFTPLLFEGVEMEPMSPSSSCILPVTVGRSASKEIIEKCIEKNVPVHSALAVAASLAFGRSASYEGFNLPNDIICGLPMDLREYITVQGYQALGKWLGHGTTTVKTIRNPIDPDQFWQEVNQVQETTSSEKPWKNFEVYQEGLNSFIRTKGDISFAAELGRSHLELYDLGKCDTSHTSDMHFDVDDISDNQVVRMDEHFFAKSMSDITMSPISLTSCLYKERLMFTVAYNQRWIVRSFATNFVDTFLTVLHEAIPITPDKIEFDKQIMAGSSIQKSTRGVQQRLAWKERVKEKQEKRQLRKSVANGHTKPLKPGDRISRPKSVPPLITPSTFTPDKEPDKRKNIHAASDDTPRHTLPRQRNDEKMKPVRYKVSEVMTMPPAVRAQVMQPRVKRVPLPKMEK